MYSPPPPNLQKVEVHLGTTVENVLGNGGGDCRSGSPVTGVLVRDDHGTREVPVRGLFYAIGHSPNTNLLQVSCRFYHVKNGRLSMIKEGPRARHAGSILEQTTTIEDDH